jgi:hypothetical protein
MDARLLAWARAAAGRPGPARRLPKLWLFTDSRRLPDPSGGPRLAAWTGRRVLRHDGEPDRETLGRISLYAAAPRPCSRRCPPAATLGREFIFAQAGLGRVRPTHYV